MSRRFKEPLIERAYLFELYKSQLISVRFLKRVQVIDTTIIMMISYKTTGTNTKKMLVKSQSKICFYSSLQKERFRSGFDFVIGSDKLSQKKDDKYEK